MAEIITVIVVGVIWGYLAVTQINFDRGQVQELTTKAKEASMKGDREVASSCYERAARIQTTNKWS